MINQQYKFQNNELGFKEIMLLFKYWLVFFYEKKNILIVFFLAGSIIGFIQVKNQKPKYTAKLSYILEENSSPSSNSTLSLISQIGISANNSVGGMFSPSYLSELMKSRMMIEKILLRPVLIENNYITLVEYYIRINDLRKKWKNTPEYKSVKFEINSNPRLFTVQQNKIITSIYSELILKENMFIGIKNKESNIPEISITNKDELFAKLFCENLLEGTSEFYIESKSRKAKNTLKLLELQLDSVRNKYNTALTSFASASEILFNLNNANKSKETNSLKKQIDIQSISALIPVLVANIENTKSTIRNETPLFQIIDKPMLPLPKETPSIIKSVLIYGMSFILVIIIFLFISQYFNIMLKNLNENNDSIT
jgi:uncharacterized protein involved in exopolysaccharide biosynthesis